MTAQFDIKTVVIPVGQTVSVQASGKFIKVLRVSPEPNQITIQTDKSAKMNLVPGQGLPHVFNTLRVSCANAVIAITVVLYVGDIPIVDVTTTQPAATLITVDWITLAASGLVQLLGGLTVQGTNYRRKTLEITNMTGSAAVANPAVLGLVTSPFGAQTAMKFVNGAWTGQQRVLPPATATELFPMLIETDDSVNVSTFELTGPLDLSIVQTWLPIIS